MSLLAGCSTGAASRVYFDPDTSAESSFLAVTERDYVASLNYYILENHAKFQLNYLRKTFAHGLAPPHNQVLVNLQTAWRPADEQLSVTE